MSLYAFLVQSKGYSKRTKKSVGTAKVLPPLQGQEPEQERQKQTLLRYHMMHHQAKALCSMHQAADQHSRAWGALASAQHLPTLLVVKGTDRLTSAACQASTLAEACAVHSVVERAQLAAIAYAAGLHTCVRLTR